MRWQFKFGRIPTTVAQYTAIGVTLAALVATLHRCTGIPVPVLKRAIDSVQRRFAPGGRVNDFIIRDPEWLDVRVRGDVSDAIDSFKRGTRWTPTEVPGGVYSEKPVDPTVCYTEECRALGGEMRACSPWVPDCHASKPNP